MTRQRFLSLLAAAALAIAPIAASAQTWPNKPVKIVVPFVAGGATDVVARLLGQKLGDLWGQTVIIENRGGAGGNIGADAVAKAPADGYTLLMTSGSIVTANPHMYESMPFDAAKDLVPITNVASGPQLLVVSTALPVRDLREFIAYAKANPSKVNMGSAGVGTQTHLAGENFAYTAGIEVTHVPYKGEAAALTDLMGGNIQLVASNFSAALNFVREGKMRAIAVTSRERMSQLPDVPSASEVLPGFENAGWFGLMAPAGTPKEVIDRVYRDTARVLQGEEFKARLAQLGMVPVGNSPSDFGAAIREESQRWAKIIRERHLKAS